MDIISRLERIFLHRLKGPKKRTEEDDTNETIDKIAAANMILIAVSFDDKRIRMFFCS